MDRRALPLAAVGGAWITLLGITAALSEGGCRSDLLAVVGYATIPMTLVLGALAAWALPSAWKIALVVGLVTSGVLNFFTYAVLLGNYGCFE